MSNWISVEDELPEYPWIMVLVAVKASNANHVESACLIQDGSWLLADESSNGADFITHWMPLPEPPKGE